MKNRCTLLFCNIIIMSSCWQNNSKIETLLDVPPPKTTQVDESEHLVLALIEKAKDLKIPLKISKEDLNVENLPELERDETQLLFNDSLFAETGKYFYLFGKVKISNTWGLLILKTDSVISSKATDMDNKKTLFLITQGKDHSVKVLELTNNQTYRYISKIEPNSEITIGKFAAEESSVITFNTYYYKNGQLIRSDSSEWEGGVDDIGINKALEYFNKHLNN
ncbi:MAG: hypothetical protein JNJ40_18425 [Bacteroidia bacterium]|nr:hypothetical protein [Bacteroidia bacterium]